MIHRSHHPAVALRIAILLTLATASCAEEAAPPGAYVGAVPIPATQLASLGEIERDALADLVGLGSAIAAGSADSLVAPLVAQEITESRVAGLPYHLAAEERGLTGQALAGAYADSPAWELTVRHVVRLVSSDAPQVRRDSARAVAAEVAARAASGEDFAALAGEFSEEPGAAERGGRLNPGREGSWVAPFWEAAAGLAPGETSGVVETIYGYHVLHLDSRRPLPYEEASRTRLLQRLIPLTAATAAMERWVTTRGAILLDGPSLHAAQQAISSGLPPSDTLVIAVGAAGARYTGDDLVASWARLEPDARMGVEAAGEAGFAGWVEDQARMVIWGGVAESMGVDAGMGIETGALAKWRAEVGRWGATAGFRPGMSHAEIQTAALAATLSGVPEARATRSEIRSLRPRLRRLYPLRLVESPRTQ